MRTPDEIQQRENYVFEIVCGAIQTATLFFPVSFLINVLSWKDMDILVFGGMGIAALLYGVALFSRTLGQAMLKWLISLPITVLYWIYFINTHFYVRSLNWVFPDYGQQSAGGSFASSFLLFLLAGLCFLTGLTGIVASCVPKKEKVWRRFGIIRHVVAFAACAVVVVTAIALERIFPSYASIFYAG